MPRKPTTPLTPGQQELVEANMRLVEAIAKRVAWAMAYRHADNDRHGPLKAPPHTVKYLQFLQFKADVTQEAYITLCKAARGFDPSLGFRFSTYACAAIKRHFSRCLPPVPCLTRYRHHKCEVVAIIRLASQIRSFSVEGRSHETTLEAWDHRDGHESPPSPTLSEEVVKAMAFVLDERRVRILRRWIEDDQFAACIAREEGVSKQRIHQMIRDSLEKLKASAKFMDALGKTPGMTDRDFDRRDVQEFVA